MNSHDRSRIAREVNEAGRCSHPVRLNSTQLNVLTGEVTSRIIKVACKDRREAVCPACSRTYGTDAWIVAATGINGGKGVSTDVAECPRIFVTMTAPGFGSVHTIRSNGRCVQVSSRDPMCEHGWPRSCGLRHDDEDRLLGLPICDQCFRYRDAVLWNAHASRLWSVTIMQTRRNLASRLGIRRIDVTRIAAVHYLKVAEMQRRGLVHFHALARLDVNDLGLSDSYASELIGAWTDAVSNVALENEIGKFQWGSVVDIKSLRNGGDDARVLASYLAKYVTKTAGEGLELARRFRSRRQIRSLVDNPHLRRMALESWDLAADPKCSQFNPRSHAHTLGYTGHLMTKSRRYSTTLTALRQARSEYRAQGLSADVMTGDFSYAGRGYDDSRSELLAELLVSWERGTRSGRSLATDGASDREDVLGE
jgi:hypothetical protein